MSNKYPSYNPDDTFWNDYNRKTDAKPLLCAGRIISTELNLKTK
jgi:hypothetical protein